jgi:hypothetical protein
MPITENNANVSANVTAFSTAFIGLCRALEHQKILTPSAIAQEILAQRNLLKDDSESRNVKQILDRITKSLQGPATPAISV